MSKHFLNLSKILRKRWWKKYFAWIVPLSRGHLTAICKWYFGWLACRATPKGRAYFGRPIFEKGRARTQSPTNTNYAPEFPSLGGIAGVNPFEVQWRGLNLEELPCWSQYPLSQVSMKILIFSRISVSQKESTTLSLENHPGSTISFFFW